jgi:hypothetical protein
MNFLIRLILVLFRTLGASGASFTCNSDDSAYCVIDGFNDVENLYINCTNDLQVIDLFLFPRRRLTYKNSYQIQNCSVENLNLNNFGQFAVDSNFLKDLNFLELIVYNSNFKFSFNPDLYIPQTFFNRNFFKQITFSNDVRYYLNTPATVFKHSSLEFLKFENLIDSKFKINYFTIESNSSHLDLNSSIKILKLNVFNLKIDNKLLNEKVFENLKTLKIFDYLLCIEKETFKPFRYLKEIVFQVYSLKNFFHTGTDWMEYLNNYVNINYSSQTFAVNQNDQMILYFRSAFISNKIQLAYRYPDEDFCLFIDFPHHHFVFPHLFNCFNTCTFMYLTQFSSYFKFSQMIDCTFEADCDFDSMARFCTKRNFLPDNIGFSPEIDYYYISDKFYKSKRYDYYVSIIAFPIVCMMGFALNLINFLVLSNKSFRKLHKDRMYNQMLLYSIINFMVCFIHSLKITIKCIDPIDNFCIISFVTNRYYRYFVSILINYFGNVLKTCSNFTQLFITIDRFILSTSMIKNGFMKKCHNIKVSTFFLATFSLSLILNIVYLFEFEINLNFYNLTFPTLQINYFNFKFAYTYLNIISIFIRSFFLFIVQIVIDVFLLCFVRKTLSKKKNLISNHKQVQQANQNIERNIKLMIIFNGLLLFLLQIPDLILSIILNYIYFFDIKPIPIHKITVDYDQNSTTFLNDLIETIYFLGYSLHFFSFYLFNKYFRKQFHKIFTKT